MKLPVNRNIGALAAASILVLGAGLADPALARSRKAQQADMTGPAGDYPVLLGDPFVIDGTTYTPADTLNYDAVGKAVPLDDAGAPRISGAHRTLPVPSYVEVTSLTSGRTILVRIDQRGPRSGPGLVGLSPMAWSQLGLAGGATAPVRVRRVNPPEPERAALRTGQAAPQRMDTPPGLLAALRRKLGLEPPVGELPVSIRPTDLAATSAQKPSMPMKPVTKVTTAPKPPVAPPSVSTAKPQPKSASAAPSQRPAAEPATRQSSAEARLYVQIGAYAQRGNAEAAARKAGGSLVRAGALWRVRSGPFSAGDEATRGLAKARAAGYAGARIVHD